MNKTQFSNALKIVAVLQVGDDWQRSWTMVIMPFMCVVQNQCQVTSEIVNRAISQPFPYPAPRITPLEAPASQNEDPPFNAEDGGSSSSSSFSDQQTRAYSLPVAPAGMSLEWGSENGGGGSISVRPTLLTQDISLDVAYSTELSDSGLLDDVPAKACLVSVQTRLAPLKLKEAANPRKLIGVNGSLIAAPSLKNGVLQYFRIQDDPQGAFDGRVKK